MVRLDLSMFNFFEFPSGIDRRERLIADEPAPSRLPALPSLSTTQMELPAKVLRPFRRSSGLLFALILSNMSILEWQRTRDNLMQ